MEDIKDLKNRVKILEEENLVNTYVSSNNQEKVESLLAYLYKRIDFSFLKKYFKMLPHPNEIRSSIGDDFITSSEQGVKNLAIELMKNMPATHLANLKRYKRVKFNLPETDKFSKVEISQIIARQDALLNNILEEQKKKFREETKALHNNNQITFSRRRKE